MGGELLAAELGGEVPELDLHGMPRAAAVASLDAFLQEAFMAGDRAVRVVHGRGEGVLREAIREAAGRHPLVEDAVASSAPGEAGAVIYLLIVER